MEEPADDNLTIIFLLGMESDERMIMLKIP